jgi:hypothetical protein
MNTLILIGCNLQRFLKKSDNEVWELSIFCDKLGMFGLTLKKHVEDQYRIIENGV